MFARKVAARLKPNSLPEFVDLMEREILPWLRKQEGFLDLITLAAPDGSEIATISFWDHEASAGRRLKRISGNVAESGKTLGWISLCQDVRGCALDGAPEIFILRVRRGRIWNPPDLSAPLLAAL
jgi:hypothetical protein